MATFRIRLDYMWPQSCLQNLLDYGLARSKGVLWEGKNTYVTLRLHSGYETKQKHKKRWGFFRVSVELDRMGWQKRNKKNNYLTMTTVSYETCPTSGTRGAEITFATARHVWHKTRSTLCTVQNK